MARDGASWRDEIVGGVAVGMRERARGRAGGAGSRAAIGSVALSGDSATLGAVAMCKCWGLGSLGHVSRL